MRNFEQWDWDQLEIAKPISFFLTVGLEPCYSVWSMGCEQKWRMPFSGLVMKCHIVLHISSSPVSQLNAESNKNSKEASEYCGATIEVHSKVTWVTAYIRISLLWHAPLHPQWLLAALQEQEITFIILNNPELESVMVASFKCPDWYRAPVQSLMWQK